MQWLRRKVAPTSGDLLMKFTDLLDNATIATFNIAVLFVAKEFRLEGNIDEEPAELSNEEAWDVQIEILWFLIGAICRDVFAIPGAQPEDRDVIQDALVSRAITHLADQMFEGQSLTPEARSAVAARLLDSYNESELYYGYVEKIAPTLGDQWSLDDNVAGLAAKRIDSRLGQEDETDQLALTLVLVKTYTAANIPKMTSDLVRAYHSFRARASKLS